MASHTPVRLSEHTWPEIKAALDDGTTTAIVAVGSVEQHGPHLPVIMDTLAGDELSRRIADRLGDALAAPTIRPGCSGHHMAFPGSITISPETLMDLVRGVNTVAPEIAREIDASVIAIADLDENMRLMNEGLREAGVEYEEPVIHAGAAETAIVLAVNEGLVRTDELAVGHEGEVSASRLLSEGFDAISENGVLGDPREGTAEAGEAILERITTAYTERIEAERDAA
ncbi:creatininase [Halobacteriales archaeon QH_9_66_26]|nr:MAG: creatininase [Halobacteriales archaeon QH_9_66_26]